MGFAQRSDGGRLQILFGADEFRCTGRHGGFDRRRFQAWGPRATLSNLRYDDRHFDDGGCTDCSGAVVLEFNGASLDCGRLGGEFGNDWSCGFRRF